MTRRRLIQTAVCAGALLLSGTPQLRAQNPAQDHGGNYATSDIVYGSQLYAAQCTTCHGADGAGVGSVNLRTGQFRTVTTDAEISRLITTGVPGAGMPPFKFDTAQLTGLVAYIRNMNSFDAKAVPLGDRARGQQIVEGTGECLKCHAIQNKGVPIAPDLSAIGANRAASALEGHLLTPDGFMMPINRPVRAVTRNGTVINGRRLNEDTYTVQIIDDKARLVSLAKADLRELNVSTKSTMPSYKGRLAPQELADVLAYLLSLKGS